MTLMHFRLPDGRPFEIPSAWWTEAAMDHFDRGRDKSYRGRPHLNSQLVLIADIDLPSLSHRRRSHGPLDRDRMVTVLWSIAEREEICPVTITKTGIGDYRYRLYAGVHRFHASVAAGFSHIPALLVVR
jgi:hypothetical protein